MPYLLNCARSRRVQVCPSVFSKFPFLAIHLRDNNELPDKQMELTRLDNMLMAEGVIGPERQLPDNSNANHADYSIKLSQIRQCYHDQISQNELTEANFAQQVSLLLQEQKLSRPITDQEMSRFIDIIRQKFVGAQIKIKQCACEKVIESKSKFFDARFVLYC